MTPEGRLALVVALATGIVVEIVLLHRASRRGTDPAFVRRIAFDIGITCVVASFFALDWYFGNRLSTAASVVGGLVMLAALGVLVHLGRR